MMTHIPLFTHSLSAYVPLAVFPVSGWIGERAHSMFLASHVLTHHMTCSVNSFADRFEKNAECPPLECWKCDGLIPTCFTSTTVFRDASKQSDLESRIKKHIFI